MTQKIEETIKLHNTLLNVLSSLEFINDDGLNKFNREKLLLIKTMIVDEIDAIRKELKVNTSTIITKEDIVNIF